MNTRVAFYARVSSERQAKTSTIESQISAIKNKMVLDGLNLLKEFEFIDDGYSGSTLLRPGLERLRDMAANHLFDKLYIHSPDRLARKYAHQYLLIEELTKLNIEIIFINNPLENNPESNLLLQVQGMIAEYERAKIMERSRRGKLHAAKQGSPSVLSGAPYGYRYIAKNIYGEVGYEIIEEEAKAIRLLFSWIANERISINAATCRLTEMKFKTPTGCNIRWNRGSVHRILKNPAYKGTAAYGKLKSIPKKQRLRPYKGHPTQGKSPYSTERNPKENWILIPVPKIIDESLFENVQVQLEENKRLKRERMTGARYLLQGLAVCALCKYGYHGNTATRSRKHNYYSCGGTVIYANRDRMCDNKSLYANILEDIVWEEIKLLLKYPANLEKEYHRRMSELEKNTNIRERNKLILGKTKLEKSIDRIIDSYSDGIIEKSEFEPRIKKLRKELSSIEQRLYQLIDNKTKESELKKIVGRIEEFSESIKEKLEDADWQTKRAIVVALIKQVEIGRDEVNIIFRVEGYPKIKNADHSLEDCRRSLGTGTFFILCDSHHSFYVTHIIFMLAPAIDIITLTKPRC
jgi:site-specific DNA recombinase